MDERVSEMYGQLKDCLDGLSGVEMVLTASMLWDFCWLHVKVEDLQKTIDMEGILADGPKGPRENPCVQPLHKFETQKNNTFSKLLKAVSKSGTEAVDKLSKFVAAR